MSRIVRRAGFMLMVATFSLSGCYRYLPVDTRPTPVGDEVRISVTRQGAAQFSAIVSRDTTQISQIQDLRGKVLGYEGSDLLLGVKVGTRQAGFHAVGLQQTVRIPTGEILSIERRELNRSLTAVVGGAVAAAGTTMMIAIIKAFGNAGDFEVEDPDFLMGFWSIPIG